MFASEERLSSIERRLDALEDATNIRYDVATTASNGGTSISSRSVALKKIVQSLINAFGLQVIYNEPQEASVQFRPARRPIPPSPPKVDEQPGHQDTPSDE